MIAGYAWYQFGQSVEDGSLIGATSWGIVAVEATVSIFIPDPVATGIGWTGSKLIGAFVRTIGPVLRQIANLMWRVARVPFLVPISIALGGRYILEEAGFYEGAQKDIEVAMKDVESAGLWMTTFNVWRLGLSMKNPSVQNVM